MTVLIDTDPTPLTLPLHQNGTIVNGKEDTDILNANNGTIDGSGNITLTLLAADTAMSNTARLREWRTALIQWTWASGTKHGSVEVRFPIVNIIQYP